MIKQRRWGLIGLLVVMALFGAAVFAQDGEPLANPDCAVDQLGGELEQVEQLYTDAQTALQDGDVRGWLDNLQAISQFANELRALCDNYVFEGDAEGSRSLVIGPITFAEGIYTVTAITDGYLSVTTEGITDECRYFGMVFSEGGAVEGATEVMRVEDEPCTLLLEIGNITEPWRVEFTLISGG